jgi:hypothetical protein
MDTCESNPGALTTFSATILPLEKKKDQRFSPAFGSVTLPTTVPQDLRTEFSEIAHVPPPPASPPAQETGKEEKKKNKKTKTKNKKERKRERRKPRGTRIRQ